MTMKLPQRLAGGEVILVDGAMGTRLYAAGLEVGAAPESWNLTNLAEVAEVANDYASAGADIVQTNSFGGSPMKLAAHGLAEKTIEINRAAAAAASEGAAGRALVSGSIGPSGGLLKPYGNLDAEEAAAGFLLQAEALVAGGADLLCVETMIDLREAVIAVQAARKALPDGVVMVSLTFDSTPRGWFTIMGNDIATAAAELVAAGADVIGSNCGQGPAGMLEIATAFAATTDRPILIQPNAGLPILEGTDVHYPESPAQMASVLPDLINAGVRVIGGCCGTTPDHTRAFREVIDRAAASQS